MSYHCFLIPSWIFSCADRVWRFAIANFSFSGFSSGTALRSQPADLSRADPLLVSILCLGAIIVAVFSVLLWRKETRKGGAILAKNARLARSAEKDLSNLVALQEFHRTLSSTLERDQLLQLLLEKISGFFGVDAVTMAIRDPQTGGLDLAASLRLEDTRLQQVDSEIRQGIAEWMTEGTRPLVIPDLQADKRLACKEQIRQTGVVSYCGVPLVTQGRTIGVLSLYSRETHECDEEETRFLLTLGNLVATTLSNLQLLQAFRTAEAQARQQALYRERVMESMADGLCVLDAEGRLVEVNHALCEMTGYSRQELINQAIPFPYCPSDEAAKLQKTIAICHTGMSAGPLEMTFRRKDGSLFSVEVTFSPLTSEDHIFIGCVGMIRNITPLKQARAALFQAEKLAAVGRLISGVAHELNNPLTAILATAQLLRANPDEDLAEQDLETICTQAERAAHIVRNLLSFARPRQAERVYMNLNETLQRALELVAYQLRVDGIQVIQRLDPHLPSTMADPHQIQQVMINLITNARQAIRSHRSHGTITLTTSLVGGKTLRFSCADDGPGISREAMEHLFEPFFTTKQNGEGTGLGLSICHRIITEHKGRIWAESEEGKGAAFSVELPVVNPGS